ncbi:hypothetical protein GOBAR_AA06483 [Gossypium barbadense]|uniref:Ribosomal protein L34e n=1 Tax=Gossypium barbadense TaxID=3634 RepID=A0A2P5YEW7_GOSBA|nr:hypothetical protein GOBAR_AA06483 [Gossypium barbadense]
MVQRLTYRTRHSYATKSNQHRVVKTPGGKLIYQTTKKRASGPKCPVTGKRIQGIPHLRPAEYKRSRLPRNRRTVNRAYGGVLSGSAVRERIIRAFLVEEQKIVKKIYLREIFVCYYGELMKCGTEFEYFFSFGIDIIFLFATMSPESMTRDLETPNPDPQLVNRIWGYGFELNLAILFKGNWNDICGPFEHSN